MNKIPNIININYLEEYKCIITFDNNSDKVIDFAPFIKSGVSSALQDITYFKKGFVQDGYLVWPNGYDCCPKTLFDLA